MIDMDVKVTLPDIKIESAGRVRWTQIGIETAKVIRTRTETQGLDVDGKKFRHYSEWYKKSLRKKGLISKINKPNLSLSGRMLGALGAGVTATENKARIALTGEQGSKAVENQQRGREFFGVTDQQATTLARQYADLIINSLLRT